MQHTQITHRLSSMRSGRLGFTLVELMVVVTIIAILASVAIPGYRQHVIRSRRASAQAEMMSLANREQQFLIANRTYADTATLTASGYALPPEVGSSYTFAVTTDAAPVPTFIITMTPTAAQASDGALTLDNLGNKGPGGKWQK